MLFLEFIPRPSSDKPRRSGFAAFFWCSHDNPPFLQLGLLMRWRPCPGSPGMQGESSRRSLLADFGRRNAAPCNPDTFKCLINWINCPCASPVRSHWWQHPDYPWLDSNIRET